MSVASGVVNPHVYYGAASSGSGGSSLLKSITDYNSNADETTFQAAIDDSSNSLFLIPTGTYTLSDSVNVNAAGQLFVCEPGVIIQIAASGYSDTREVDLNSKDRNSAFYVTSDKFEFYGAADTYFDMQADVYDGTSKYMNAFLLNGAGDCVIDRAEVRESHNGVMLYNSSGYASGNRVHRIRMTNAGTDANFKNAAIDLYGQENCTFSDLYADNYEEVADFNGDCRNIHGTGIVGVNVTQYVVEIQNSVNVEITNFSGLFTDTNGGLLQVSNYSGPTLVNENIHCTNGSVKYAGIQHQTPSVWIEDCNNGHFEVSARMSHASSNGEFLIIGQTSNDVSTVENVTIDLNYWQTHNTQVKSVCGWRSGNGTLRLNFRGTPTANFGIVDLKTANVGRVNVDLTGISVDSSGNENQVASSIGVDVDSTATNAVGLINVNMDVATEINNAASASNDLWTYSETAV